MKGIALLLDYVDDILITGDDKLGIKELQQTLLSSFHMKDLGPITYFLGLEVICSNRGIMLTQTKYAKELIDLARLGDSKPMETPMEIIDVRFHKDFSDPISDPTLYRKRSVASST